MLLTLVCTGTECNVLVSNLPCSYSSLRALQCSVMHCLHRGCCHLPSLLLSLPSCLGYAACHAACHAVCQGAWRIRLVWFVRRMHAIARAREGQSVLGGFMGFDGIRTHMHSKICDDKSAAREQLLTLMGAPGS